MRIHELNAYEKTSIERIKYLIENYCDGSQAEFAARCGLNRSSITHYMNHAHAPTRQTAMKVSEAFGVNPDWVQGYDAPMRKDASPDDRTTEIPVYGRIPSDVPVNQVTHIVGTEEVKKDTSASSLFAFSVPDDSMHPKIDTGDVVIIAPDIKAKDNDLVLVAMRGKDASVRRLKTYADSVAFISDNPAYPPEVFAKAEKNDMEILGKVIELRSRF